jgi:hypothetical protein
MAGGEDSTNLQKIRVNLRTQKVTANGKPMLYFKGLRETDPGKNSKNPNKK